MFWNKKKKEVQKDSDDKNYRDNQKHSESHIRSDCQNRYDRETLRPVIRASICTGEQVAGFRDIRTGKFTDIMLIKNQKDLNRFLKEYGVEEQEIQKEY